MAAKSPVSYHIYLPDIYHKETLRRFPVLYWLHGTGGGLPGIAKLAAFFDDAIRAGKTPAMLVVFANGLATSLWCDSKDGSVPMESVVVEELVPHVDATTRTRADRGGRLIEGFSMGGYGAARLGLKYPGVFGAISILAGGPLDPEFRGPKALSDPALRERILRTVFSGDLEAFKAQSPWVLAARYGATAHGRTPIRIAIGSLDFTLGDNRNFSGRLDALSIPHTFSVVPDVGHDSLSLMRGLGESNWAFYREVFGFQ